MDEMEQMQLMLQKEQDSNDSLKSELLQYKQIVNERDISAAKLHSLEIKYQTDIEYYEK